MNLLNRADLFPSAALPLFLTVNLHLIDVHLLAPLHRRSHPGHELQVSHPPSFNGFVQLARTSKIVLKTLLRPPVPDQLRSLKAPCPQCHLSSQTACLASAQPGQVKLNIFKLQISPPPPRVRDRTPPSGQGPARHRPRNLWLQHRHLSSPAPCSEHMRHVAIS